jgi:hypothetical protein
VLGGSFLRIFDLIVDYPSHRVLLRCRTDLEDGACHILPWCGQNDGDDPRCPGLSG